MIREPSGSKVLTDELILQCIDEAYTKHNFTGLVGWHYYNEPMVEHKRVFSLMERYPKGRYILWTNGLIQPDDPRINLFEQVYCTNYYPDKVNKDYYNGCKKVSIFPEHFDNRRQDTANIKRNHNHCLRPYVEFIIDNWGTAHLCCQDWRGEIDIGNIWDVGFEAVLKKRKEIMDKMRLRELPDRCIRCVAKIRHIPKFDEAIQARTMEALV
jgi:hypothetical protein